MAEKKYRVVLAGRFTESADAEQANALLSDLLRVPPARVARFVSGRRIPIHRELGQSEAEALRARLEAAGVPASVEPLAELELETAPEPDPAPKPESPPAARGGVEIIEIEATGVEGLAQSGLPRRPRRASAVTTAPALEPSPPSEPPDHAQEAAPPKAETEAEAEAETEAETDAGHEQFFDTRVHPNREGVAPSSQSAPKRSPNPLVLGAGAVLVLALLGGGAYLWFRGGTEQAPPVAQPAQSQTRARPASPVEQRLRALARSVKVWMIQFGIGYDPSQVTVKRLRQDMGLKDADLQDPWGTPMRYEPAGAGFRVFSAGPDRRFGTGDDVEVSDKL